MYDDITAVQSHQLNVIGIGGEGIVKELIHEDHIATIPAAEPEAVITGTADENVIAAPSVIHIVPGQIPENIVAAVPDQGVIAASPPEHIMSAAAQQQIVAAVHVDNRNALPRVGT